MFLVLTSNSKHIPKLTLFPRVSKTSKANFGYRFAILREHFFKHRFLKMTSLSYFTLMKGDEGVKSEKNAPMVCCSA